MVRHHRLVAALAGMLLLATSFALPVGAETGAEGPGAPIFMEWDAGIDETPSLWFVELNGAPGADGGTAAALKKEKDDFRKAARQAGVTLTERYAFDSLFNGFSVEIAPGQLNKLARVPGVKALYPVVSMSLPTNTPDEYPDMGTAIAMTGVDIVQNQLGLTGEGIRVAVMDTGIDYHHPDLGGCFGPGCRVVTGWDFVGDAFNADPTSASYNPNPVPDNDPDDCHGHGTHVAGIIGANGGITGVAPNVTFGAYRVFGCTGSTTADIMIAAMERALADGMHILNMSIGSAFQWPQYPTAKASDRMVNQGMVVVASIGNSGANGVYSAGAPGLGEKVIGVASFDNTNSTVQRLVISPDNRQISFNLATGAPPPPYGQTYPIARTGTTTTLDDACTPMPAGSLEGHVALIRRGTCSFHEKALHAQQAGAVGVILYNNTTGTISPTVVGDTPIIIPVSAITQADGVLINTRLDSGSVTTSWSIVPGGAISTAGRISSFSSYGLAPDLTLKPDIGGPGGSIYAPYPIEKGSYASLSGTSMSSPHVAGTVALLLEAHPRTPAQAVRTILQNNAVPQARKTAPIGALEAVHRQGAGMVAIDRALAATSRVEPSKLSLGESEAGPATRTLTIKNSGSQAVTFNVSHAPAVSTSGSTFSPTISQAYASVAFETSSVTVPAGGQANVTLTITAPTGLADRGQYGGYIVFTSEDGTQVYHVPYAGFKGDYQSIQALTPTAQGYPRLTRQSGSSYINLPNGATFTMQGNDIPYIQLHLDHQVRRLRMEVFEANTGRAFHRAMDLEYVGRNSTATAFNAYPWDGVTTNGNRLNVVPNGTYVIRLSVLKALGDSNNPDHWETWTSPPITIARP